MRPFARHLRSTIFATSALSMLGFTPAAFAQDGASVDTGEEIIVTARRTEERLETVPVAVSAFSERALDRIQASDSTGLQGAVPNLNIVQGRGSSNATNIYIRGIGQPDALQTFDPAVGVYVDDVYYSRIRGTQLDLLDLERVEVLRGPQGTLYGKNTIGGALKVVTRKPGQTFRGGISAAYGSYDQMEIKASASGPVSETLAAGFAVMHAKRDGYVKDRVLDREYNDKNTIALRGSLAYTPSSDFRVDLSIDYSRDDAAMTVGQPLNSLTYLTLVAGVEPVLLPLPNNPGDYDFTGRTTPRLPNSTKLTHWGTSMNMAYDLSDIATLRSITAYRKLRTDDYVDIDATQLEVGDVFVGVRQNQFSQEFQLNVTTDRLTAVAGLYYMRENITSHQKAFADDLVNLAALRAIFTAYTPELLPLLGPSDFPTFLRTVDDDLKTSSYAAFANMSYEIAPALRVAAGIRYTKEKRNYFRTTSTFSSAPSLNGAPYIFAPRQSWDDWSPMASIDYRFADNLMVYVRASKGFKSGGFNGRANQIKESTAYAPETVWSYEAGLKGSLDNILRFSATVFHNDYKDFQARVSGMDVDPVTNLPMPALSVLNAGKLKIRGAELELALTPITGLMLDTQIGYLDAEYKVFDDIRFPNGSRAFQRPAFAPKWTMRFGAQYEADLGGAGFLTVGGQSRYRSTTALAIDNTYIVNEIGTTTEIAGLFQRGYWLHDARIVWEDDSRRYSLGVYGQNLSDKRYKTDGQDFSSIGSIRTVYYGAPRTFTVRAGVKF